MNIKMPDSSWWEQVARDRDEALEKTMANEQPTEFNIEPNYDHIFRTMLAEARTQGDPEILFSQMSDQRELEALRAVQRFLAPLAIAANAMHSGAMVEQFREAITEISVRVAGAVTKMEAAE
jgi:hypothetical protein